LDLPESITVSSRERDVTSVSKSYQDLHELNQLTSYAILRFSVFSFVLTSSQVEVRWNDRQFRLPNHVANKIAMGATRNIVVRNGASKNLNESGIREDLEHIHNLVVISLTISKGDIFISTNSVHNALFARTCMMSRAIYKGLRIDWYPDECAGPLPHVQEKVIAASLPPQMPAAQLFSEARKKNAKSSNLYALLDMDEAEESDSSTDEENEMQSQALPDYPNGVGISWADSIVVA
jgi:hypothetical protein